MEVKAKHTTGNGGGYLSYALSHPLRVIYPIAVINSLLLIIMYGPQQIIDSETYISAISIFQSGSIDHLRTPAYPMVLGALRHLVGETHFCTACIALQHLAHLASVALFYRLAIRFRLTPAPAFVATLIYALLFASWSNWIMTEAMSVVGILIVTYCCTAIIDRRSMIHVALATATMLFLLFLRPAFIYLAPCFALWVFFATWHDRTLKRCAVAALAGVAVVVGAQLSYMQAFNRQHGVFAMSSVSDLNQFVILRNSNLLDPSGITSAALRQDATIASDTAAITDQSQAYHLIVDNHGVAGLHQLVTSSIQAHPAAWLKKAAGRIVQSTTLHDIYLDWQMPIWIVLVSFVSFDFGVFYTMLALFTAVFIHNYRHRQRPLLSAFVLLIMIVNMATALLGAQAGWWRLNIPVMPLYLLMAGQLLSMLKITLKPRAEREMA